MKTQAQPLDAKQTAPVFVPSQNAKTAQPLNAAQQKNISNLSVNSASFNQMQPVMPHNMRAVSNEQVTTAMLDQFQTKPGLNR